MKGQNLSYILRFRPLFYSFFSSLRISMILILGLEKVIESFPFVSCFYTLNIYIYIFEALESNPDIIQIRDSCVLYWHCRRKLIDKFNCQLLQSSKCLLRFVQKKKKKKLDLKRNSIVRNWAGFGPIHKPWPMDRPHRLSDK